MPQLYVNHTYRTNYGDIIKIVNFDTDSSPFVYVADNGDRYTPMGRANCDDEDYDVDEEVVTSNDN